MADEWDLTADLLAAQFSALAYLLSLKLLPYGGIEM